MKRVILSVAVATLIFTGCVTSPETKSDCKTKECLEAKAKAESYTISTPEQALAELVEGNKRFVNGQLKSPRTGEIRRLATENSQNPYVAIVACSDSRVPVEQLFDQGIGDIFVIRTAGNTVSSDITMGSVDYAIDHLEVPLVVVLGHQNCGGVTSAITVSEDYGHATEEHLHHGKITELIEIIRDDVEPYVGKPFKLTEAIHHNTHVQADRIRETDYVAELIKQGKLQVVEAYYNIETGEVEIDK